MRRGYSFSRVCLPVCHVPAPTSDFDRLYIETNSTNRQRRKHFLKHITASVRVCVMFTDRYNAASEESQLVEKAFSIACPGREASSRLCGRDSDLIGSASR